MNQRTDRRMLVHSENGSSSTISEHQLKLEKLVYHERGKPENSVEIVSEQRKERNYKPNSFVLRTVRATRVPTSLTCDVTFEIAENDWDRGSKPDSHKAWRPKLEPRSQGTSARRLLSPLRKPCCPMQWRLGLSFDIPA